MYKLLLNSLGNLIAGLSETNEIQPERTAESYDHYMTALNSGYHYASRYRKWDVCWIQWGNNLKPEMSYKHMGIVFKVNNKMAYALPITSISQNPRLQDAYHPVDNPYGNKIFYRMNAADFIFLAHDSAIKLRLSMVQFYGASAGKEWLHGCVSFLLQKSPNAPNQDRTHSAEQNHIDAGRDKRHNHPD